jgi:hypothetical protein
MQIPVKFQLPANPFILEIPLASIGKSNYIPFIGKLPIEASAIPGIG